MKIVIQIQCDFFCYFQPEKRGKKLNRVKLSVEEVSKDVDYCFETI